MRRCRICGFDNDGTTQTCTSCGAQLTPPSSGPAQGVTPGPFPGVAGSKVESTTAVYPAGHMYAERYRIKEFIGRGGMGSVYRVTDIVEQKDMALKILHANTAEEDGAERFKREIEILSRINHPAVPKIYGWGKAGGELYFVAEFIDGRDLKTEIRKRGPWPPLEAAELIATVADCLSAAHAKGIVHRDVKPHNIMITSDGSVRLLDFGIARAKGQDMATLTKTGMIVGTPEYMAPEQFSTHNVDERSDIYSLGVVLYEMLVGKLPFEGQTPVAIAMAHMQQPSPPPRLTRKDVPAWLDRAVLRCLEKDPRKRFLSAMELVAELRRPRTGARPSMRWLTGGDAVVEDTSEMSEWALVLSSSKEKTGWEIGSGFRFEENLYKLMQVVPPDERSKRWNYRFTLWPPQEIFRRIIDYEKDRQEREAPQKEPFFFKLKKAFKKE